jgi:hypothetical protein
MQLGHPSIAPTFLAAPRPCLPARRCLGKQSSAKALLDLLQSLSRRSLQVHTARSASCGISAQPPSQQLTVIMAFSGSKGRPTGAGEPRPDKMILEVAPTMLGPWRTSAMAQAFLDLKRRDHGMLDANRWGLCAPSPGAGAAVGKDASASLRRFCAAGHAPGWGRFQLPRLLWAMSPACRRYSLGCGLPIRVDPCCAWTDWPRRAGHHAGICQRRRPPTGAHHSTELTCPGWRRTRPKPTRLPPTPPASFRC